MPVADPVPVPSGPAGRGHRRTPPTDPGPDLPGGRALGGRALGGRRGRVPCADGRAVPSSLHRRVRCGRRWRGRRRPDRLPPRGRAPRVTRPVGATGGRLRSLRLGPGAGPVRPDSRRGPLLRLRARRPHPHPVAEAVARHRAWLDEDTHRYMFEHQAELEDAVIEAAADYLGAAPGDTALTDPQVAVRAAGHGHRVGPTGGMGGGAADHPALRRGRVRALHHRRDRHPAQGLVRPTRRAATTPSSTAGPWPRRSASISTSARTGSPSARTPRRRS